MTEDVLSANVVERALAKLVALLDGPEEATAEKRTRLTATAKKAEAESARLTDAIAAGDAPEPLLAALRAREPARNVRYLLSGLARCATCGGGMEVFKRWSDKANVYGCATHRRKGPSICENSAVIEMGIADAAVLAVVERALDPELLAAVVDRTAEKLAGQANRRTQLEAQLGDVEAQIRRATSAILAGGELSPLVEALRGLETERQRLERELKARSATFDRGKLRQALQKHAADWRAMLRRRAENARSILRRFVAERFVFTPNQAGGYLFRGEGDLGLLLQMASQSVPSWNQIVGFVEAMRRLRDSAGFAA